MITKMTFQIEEIYTLLDEIPPNTYKEITLPRSDVKIVINGQKNKIFNALYLRAKEEEVIQCSCCGAIPSYATYSTRNGIRMFVSEKNYMTLDHHIPKSKGGLSTKDNLKVMCSDCNNKKADILELTNTKEVFEISHVFEQLRKKYKRYTEDLRSLKNKLYQEGIYGVLDIDTFKDKVFKQLKKIIYTLELNQIVTKLVAI